MNQTIASLFVFFLTFHLWADEASSLYLKGNLQESEKILREELNSGNIETPRKLFLAKVLFDQKKWSHAKQILSELKDETLASPEVDEYLGRTLFALKKFEEALPYYSSQRGKLSKQTLRLERAEILMHLGRDREALRALKGLSKEAKPLPRTYYLLGKLRLSNGHGRWASQSLWKAFQQGYVAKDMNFLLAQAFFEEGRLSGSLKRSGPWSKKQALASVRGGHLFVRVDPFDKNYYYICDEDTALFQVMNLLEQPLYKNNQRVLYIAAQCWLSLGQNEIAKKYVQQLNDADKSGLVTKFELSCLERNKKEIAANLKKIEKLNSITNDEKVEMYLEAALIMQIENDLGASLQYTLSAEKINPGRAEVLRYLVELYLKQNQKEKAYQKAKVLARLHPDSADIKLLTNKYHLQDEPIFSSGNSLDVIGGTK